MTQGWRIAAVLAVTAVATVAEAATAPALSVPVGTTVPTPTVTVGPVTTTPTVTVPPVPPPVTPPPVSPPPVVSNPPRVTPPPVPKVNPPTVPNATLPGSGSGSGSSGGGGGSGGGGSVDGVVNGVKQVLPKTSGAGGGTVANATSGLAGSVGGGGGGYSTPGTTTSGMSPIFGGTPGGPGGGGFSGPGGFAGPGGFGGGPGSPAAFALGIARGPNWTVTGNGTGGVSAFAAAVASLAGCFYALTPLEQQVLIVRSGIDGREALSRSQVAALLGTTPAAIRATERNAFRELRGAARASGCMPVGGAGPAAALTAFIGGPFGPLGYVTPGMPPTSRGVPGSSAAPQTQLANTSFADRLATLEGTGQASLSVLMIIAVMLSGALAALFVEARRSVH
jgi:hypothetical protein